MRVLKKLFGNNSKVNASEIAVSKEKMVSDILSSKITLISFTA